MNRFLESFTLLHPLPLTHPCLGMLAKYLPYLTCLIARLLRYDNSDITLLCACCRALNTNDHSAPDREVILFAFLRKNRQICRTEDEVISSPAGTSKTFPPTWITGPSEAGMTIKAPATWITVSQPTMVREVGSWFPTTDAWVAPTIATPLLYWSSWRDSFRHA
jgi:hypothetical protein